MIFLTFFLPLAVIVHSNPYFGSERYYYNSVELTWNYARLSCRAKGGVLASVQSERDSDIFKSRFNDVLRDHAWIGASENRKKGFWEWEQSQCMPRQVGEISCFTSHLRHNMVGGSLALLYQCFQK